MENEIIKKYWKPTISEVIEWIKENKDVVKDTEMEPKDIISFYKWITEEDMTKRGLDVYSNLVGKNADVIYKQQLSKFTKNGDTQWMLKEIEVLRQKWIIRDIKGFMKNVLPLIKEDRKTGI
jgi:uncharacterized protein with gpF-like domain